MFKSRRLFYALFSPVSVIAAAFVSNTLVIAEGESMQPTINPPGTDRELLLVDIFSPVRSGDVVVLRHPDETCEKLCKRITGMDGDVIAPSQSKRLVIVPKGRCWVEGDNAPASSDSNEFGTVPMNNVIGNMFTSSLELGDVHKSGDMSLVAGNTSGNVAIFKGEQLWQKMTSIGLITAVGVDNILNCWLDTALVICGKGWCHIFLRLHQRRKLQNIHMQRILANTKVLFLRDIDGNGEQELVLGLTDRVVRSYRWCWTSALFPRNSTLKSITGNRGILVCLYKWEFAHQLGAVTLSYQAGGKSSLLVAQPGGTSVKIKYYVDQEKTVLHEVDAEARESANQQRATIPYGTFVDYHPLCISSMRNQNASTEILGDIETGRKCQDRGTPYAVATVDGTLMLVHD